MIEKDQKIIFEKWIHQHKALIFKIVRAYAMNDMDRDDLFQDISIQLWRSIPGFRSESAVTTWIYRISVNTAIKWQKKERKTHSETLENTDKILFEKEHHVDERLDWLYEEIYQLDLIDRSLCLMLLENFSYKEMSLILGISESNVGVKINRIKKHLITKSKKHTAHGI